MGLLALLLSGCSPVPDDPHAVLEEKAAKIDAATQDLLEDLEAAGLSGASARGIVESCQSQPAPGAAYRAGIGVTVGEDLAAGYDAFVEQIEKSGWQAVDAGLSADPDAPAGRYVRDDITADIKTGGFTSGGVEYGADGMDIGVTIADECVRIPGGDYYAELSDLEKEIPPRE